MIGERQPAHDATPPIGEAAARTLTVLHPAAGVRYTSLVAAVCPEVEAGLGPSVAAHRVRAASVDPPMLRLAPWRRERSAFGARLHRLAESQACLVLADVRDCYGRIEPEAVEASLRRLGCEAGPAGGLRTFLARLGERGVRGLPVGPRPSAVLANAVLARVDDALAAAGAPHLRWVDDFVVGAPTPAAAPALLELLRRELATLRLELNETKTRIVLDPRTAADRVAPSGGKPSRVRSRTAVG